MMKLIIADDERIIRETISNLIDWKEYDIEVIGLCQNGIEAYDMILDESPDIVLTDIRMPGMSGLDLIKKISLTDLHTQFIILSGYGEFEYAKEAMRYGVKHYILKPCNETQIIECVSQCRKDCTQLLMDRKIRSQHFSLQSGMLNNVISSILNDRLCQNKPFDQIMPEYEQYIDFSFTPYRLLYVYYLEYGSLPEFLERLRSYAEKYMPRVILYGAYVNNTLLLFFQSIGNDIEGLSQLITGMGLERQHVSLETRSVSYSCLKNLLEEISDKLKRFGMIYYINHFHITFTCNYNLFITQIQSLYSQVKQGDRSKMGQIGELLKGINEEDFLKQLASSLFLKFTADLPYMSTFELAEWLMELNRETSLDSLKEMILHKLHDFLDGDRHEAAVSSMTQQIYAYVEENLQDSNLTLKYIAENHLFMNVDYVSKKFYKETGQKFSQYLTKMRILKARQLISAAPSEPVKNIAEQVGCGNNPQYFSQLFKKQTGMTPTEYISSMGSLVY